MDIVAKNRFLPTFRETISMLFTFGLATFAWIFFRAENLAHAMSYIKNMITGLKEVWVYDKALNYLTWQIGYVLPILILFFFSIEWIGRGGGRRRRSCRLSRTHQIFPSAPIIHLHWRE